MIKGIMFDMGGTLVTDENISFLRGIEALYPYLTKKNVSFEEYSNYASRLKKDTIDVRTTFDCKLVDYISALMKLCDDSLSISDSMAEEVFSKGFSVDKLVDGIIPLLEELKRENIHLIVLSNTVLSSNELRRRLHNLRIDQYFDDIISSSDNLVRKPSLCFFEIGLKRLNLDKSEVLYIGNDYKMDVLPCEELGMHVIYLNRFNKNYLLKDTSCEVNDYHYLLENKIWQTF